MNYCLASGNFHFQKRNFPVSRKGTPAPTSIPAKKFKLRASKLELQMSPAVIRKRPNNLALFTV
tara:strand:+ start:292 stop:483 length:192 start_codon:yes stop_codon:yes gene_type:complete